MMEKINLCNSLLKDQIIISKVERLDERALSASYILYSFCNKLNWLQSVSFSETNFPNARVTLDAL